MYVHDHNTKYSHPINEINENVQVLVGYKIDKTHIYDELSGHKIYRFSGCLKKTNSERIIDIYIPNNDYTGRAFIKEVKHPFQPDSKEKAYLYVQDKFYNDKEFFNHIKTPAIVLKLKEKRGASDLIAVPEIFLSFYEDANIKEAVKDLGWYIEPNFDWKVRKKTKLWALRSRYFLSVPIDVAAIALAISIADDETDDQW